MVLVHVGDVVVNEDWWLHECREADLRFSSNNIIIVDNEFLGKKIQHAIDKLPENFKTVAILRDVQELSYDDISNILNVPLGTVKSRINRARIQLQEELKNFL